MNTNAIVFLQNRNSSPHCARPSEWALAEKRTDASTCAKINMKMPIDRNKSKISVRIHFMRCSTLCIGGHAKQCPFWVSLSDRTFVSLKWKCAHMPSYSPWKETKNQKITSVGRLMRSTYLSISRCSSVYYYIHFLCFFPSLFSFCLLHSHDSDRLCTFTIYISP